MSPKQPIWKTITLADVILVCLLAVLGIGSPIIFKRTERLPGKTAVIKVAGKQWQRISLEGTKIVSIPGALGVVKAKVEDSGIRVIESGCPHKYCLGAGKASLSGAWIVCAPNKVFITVEGQFKDQKLDGISE
jgi:hypothetical protein